MNSISDTSDSPIINTVSADQFFAVDLRVAKVVAVDAIEGADKLWKITLDVGEVATGGLGERVVAAGIKAWYTPEELVGRLVVYVANLEPRTLRGVVSQGMLLAADDGRAVLLAPDQTVAAGTQVH